ncbi:metal ABC transporter solute-binding protein [Levilactobacillus tujiorum]|uniref:Zinc ABC transporter solute-binding protein n=1 Tax=Levilactobacillus tujiorum TaxID=2912243 RepID=A0ABX1L6P0_9LACO|nr:metal ABC transporter solute-binding protein [Levilactobacillus tujiorum]MCH5464883.1 metal ABC transporter solute-binding protein [Levilactobacillus tujiorum]NLR11944.1 zinc ABC transporter solute-binding protein [Lactobacillus sp. HBUAS51387]NLR29918.1 zinc ABC transporter solute-binding protein [Levilactobacillus tujiorum]
MSLFKKVILGSISLSMIVLTLTACRQNTASTPISKTKPIHVVASLDFYGEVAQAVLGNHGTVTTIVKSASVDPHDFEPTPKEAATIAQANVVLSNGLGYDHWMQKIVKSSQNHPQNIRVGEDVMAKKLGDNEHIWYDPETMARTATYLAQQFGKKAPRYQAVYQRNAAKYIKHLAPLQQQIKTLKQNSRQQRVDVSEPVFDYALTALGYRRNNTSFEIAVENGTDPSPQAIKQMRQDIQHHRIAFLVNNRQASSKIVKHMVQLAKQHNVPVLNVTETLPKGQTYLTWMQAQYRQLAKIQAATD